MAANAAAGGGRHRLGKDEAKVVFASSLGTIFEWYDFYLYATLAPFFAALFFPKGNDTAALLSAFATYAAGFLVRPFGALVFGRLGDIVGRKYTFLLTILVMGLATFAVGLLPTFETAGWLAPDHAGRPASPAGPRAWRRIRRRGDLRSGACRIRAARLRHRVDPDHRHAGLLPVAGGNRRPPFRQRDDACRLRAMGLADSVPCIGVAADFLGIHPAAAE